MDAETIGRRYTWLCEVDNDPPMVGRYNLWVTVDGSGWYGTHDMTIFRTTVDANIADRLPNRFVVMLWPLFQAYVESHRQAWNTGAYYVLGVAKTGAVQVWNMGNGATDAYLLHEWPNLHSACSWLETWKNGAGL